MVEEAAFNLREGDEMNPTNEIKDSMWNFLKDGEQKGDVKALKDAVYTLIQMTTQKNAGQREAGKNVPFEILDLLKWQIICEATALVLSGELDRLEEEANDT